MRIALSFHKRRGTPFAQAWTQAIAANPPPKGEPVEFTKDAMHHAYEDRGRKFKLAGVLEEAA